jgi:hypothetical protein
MVLAVEAAIANDPSASYHSIDVLLPEGVVNLSGKSENILANE